jgi:hypothetical protein
MERRNFIQGLLAAVGGGTAMVKLASPVEAKILAIGQDILLKQPTPHFLPVIDGLDEVYLRNGDELIPIGTIISVGQKPATLLEKEWEGRIALSPGFARFMGRK